MLTWAIVSCNEQAEQNYIYASKNGSYTSGTYDYIITSSISPYRDTVALC